MSKTTNQTRLQKFKNHDNFENHVRRICLMQSKVDFDNVIFTDKQLSTEETKDNDDTYNNSLSDIKYRLKELYNEHRNSKMSKITKKTDKCITEGCNEVFFNFIGCVHKTKKQIIEQKIKEKKERINKLNEAFEHNEEIDEYEKNTKKQELMLKKFSEIKKFKNAKNVKMTPSKKVSVFNLNVIVCNSMNKNQCARTQRGSVKYVDACTSIINKPTRFNLSEFIRKNIV
ncbi:hypothetical protein [Heterosigma akashiwo virus 01]|uniref:Uncharacterized protein n=1 Tax=Heterosigma akashiwo virus 01 TaxID=97195 RepID=A0A1C9C5D7_HAV01|nr:hypothetical protein D1R72_gp173 [Heterosigma akashiwo virus 01]AOM63504.1 hypothetical protein [Heterosigma akashiwo virus 01]